MGSRDTAPGEFRGAVLSCGGASELGMVVQYDGSDYHGFQRQSNAQPTIQGTLETVLERLMGPGMVIGASRTDSGVHAEGQVVVWRGPIRVPLERVGDVLNRTLPGSIRVRRVSLVPAGWDPRRARSVKQYSYRIWRPDRAPSLERYRMVWERSGTLSWDRIQLAAAVFIGQHDFRAFRTEGSSAETTQRTIVDSAWSLEDQGRIWRYQVKGDGFLYRMVRHMVGAMVEAAGERGSLMKIQRGIANPRCKVTALAVARGLTLDHISFLDGPDL